MAGDAQHTHLVACQQSCCCGSRQATYAFCTTRPNSHARHTGACVLVRGKSTTSRSVLPTPLIMLQNQSDLNVVELVQNKKKDSIYDTLESWSRQWYRAVDFHFAHSFTVFLKATPKRIWAISYSVCLFLPDSSLAASIPKNKHLHHFERPSVVYCHCCLFWHLFWATARIVLYYFTCWLSWFSLT